MNFNDQGQFFVRIGIASGKSAMSFRFYGRKREFSQERSRR